jgi:hypothetical protein
MRYSQQQSPADTCGNLENLNLLRGYTGDSRRPAVMNAPAYHTMITRRFSAVGCALLKRILRYCQAQTMTLL